MACPLCHKEEVGPYAEDNLRSYLNCRVCDLVFVPREHWLSASEEKAIYDLHENDENDPGYRKFLSRLTQPLLERLGEQKQGLDFGCGPGPALARVMEEAGHAMALFDLFYYNRPGLLDVDYDFICTTEVVEHFQAPGAEFEALFKRLRPGGWLGIMTKLVKDPQAFKNWHYIRDLTHISFYSRTTFAWLARQFNAHVEILGNDVILMQKKI